MLLFIFIFSLSRFVNPSRNYSTAFIHQVMDSKYYKSRFPNNHYNDNRNGYNQFQKRRPNFKTNSRKDNCQVDPISFERWEKIVKEKIPRVVEQFYLASYKDIEEGLDKLNLPKNLYNYLDALDALLQSKKLYMVHHKPGK